MVHADVGIVHPGSMGAQVAAQAAAAGVRVWWSAQGRSEATRERAGALGLQPARSMAELARECAVILSVCPPAAALDVARQVAATGFDGVYADANAISPRRMEQITRLMRENGATVADGGITGPPPREAGSTRLYLCGDEPAVETVRALFDGTPLTPVVLAGPVGRASALKLGFAAYNKISYALAAEASALAADHGVLDDLRDLAAHLLPDTPLARGRSSWRALGPGPGAGSRRWGRSPRPGEAVACRVPSRTPRRTPSTDGRTTRTTGP